MKSVCAKQYTTLIHFHLKEIFNLFVKKLIFLKFYNKCILFCDFYIALICIDNTSTGPKVKEQNITIVTK